MLGEYGPFFALPTISSVVAGVPSYRHYCQICQSVVGSVMVYMMDSVSGRNLAVPTLPQIDMQAEPFVISYFPA
jgi:hypothetical protein